jgi:predicted acetyltransferase
MKIRKLKVSERDRIVDGDMYAYSHWVHPLCIKPKLGIINPNDVLVAEIDGTIAAALQCFEWSQWVRGSLRSMGGIGGVWTYPEFRNRGCVKALMKAALMEMDLRGLGLSMLMPFKESFYSSLGYVVANSNLRLTVPLTAWHKHITKSDITKPDITKTNQDLDRDTNWQIERRPAGDCQGQLVDFLSVALHGQLPESKFLPHDHGVLLPLFNSEQWWHLQRSRLAVWVKEDQEPMGVALYGIDSSGNLPFEQRHIDISTMFARSEAAWTQLLGFFASHRDQVAQVQMTFPFGVNPHRWFRDSPTPLQGNFLQPWMVRIVNAVNALHGLKIGTNQTEPQTMALMVTDGDCGWNNGLVWLTATEGVLTAKHGALAEMRESVSMATPPVQITIQGLGALIYGSAGATELQAQGQIETNTETVMLLEQWFPKISLYNPFLF